MPVSAPFSTRNPCLAQDYIYLHKEHADWVTNV
jgi:hypothetical protein